MSVRVRYTIRPKDRRLASRGLPVIPRDGFFYLTLTRIMDSFSCSPLFLLIYLFIYLFYLFIYLFYFKVDAASHDDVLGKDSMGNIRFSIQG